MQAGPYPIQLFITLMIIFGAACVALICDHLKQSNEQLRELAIELRVRREEELKRFRMIEPRGASPKRKKAAQESLESAPAARALAAPEEKKRVLAPEALAAMQRGAQLAGAPRV